ncbi:MAG: F0F1 ATP synthase subunit B [Bacteroidales bacterium]|jgi:F-type H+-transporting ATPase subunit b|nr:F0F1 ATP synthase subunit B [Bacteroidales bacterium]
MELITPSFGLIFWMLIGFGILVFILAKYAWPVIIKMINEREQFIQQQLTEAGLVRDEMKNLKSEHAQLLIQAKDERDKIITDARKMVEKMNDEARLRREREADTMLNETRKAIENEKMKALTEIKNEIANLSIEVAEKILRSELKESSRQEEFIQQWVAELKMKENTINY